MDVNCTYISYQQTGFFSKPVTDYLSGNPQLTGLYEYSASLDGIKSAINARKQFSTDRKLLSQVLLTQYNDVACSPALQNNLSLLTQDNTFTVTTAHQPNIFTGPLYFIYKILHAIKLSQILATEMPGNNFVPVYYMGSEDADLNELNNITIEGKQYVWNTNQTGAVGRMKVDKVLLVLIDEIYRQIGVHAHASEITGLLKKHYTLGNTIQQATLNIVNELFGQYGLVVIIPDNKLLKSSFSQIVRRELTEGFSCKAVAKTVAVLAQHYKVQAAGRDLNLFYLIDNKRERIEQYENGFIVKGLGLRFTQEQMFDELEQYPDRFSANVILRGVFQETILPNIAFIGGGGELAYWLELKNVFSEANIPYPVLILRNSFLLIEKKWQEKADKLQLQLTDLFRTENDWMNTLVQHQSTSKISLPEEIQQLQALYIQIQQAAGTVDASLSEHVIALQTHAVKKLQALEKKMLRAEKKNMQHHYISCKQ